MTVYPQMLRISSIEIRIVRYILLVQFYKQIFYCMRTSKCLGPIFGDLVYDSNSVCFLLRANTPGLLPCDVFRL